MNFFKRTQGGILTGSEIHKQVKNGRIEISPYNEKNLNPNSYNIHTGYEITMYDDISILDMRLGGTMQPTIKTTIPDSGYILRPGNLYLIPTLEVIGSDYYEPIITGRSSIGRLGVSLHQEAGFADIGYHGQLTMQIKVTYPTKIYPELSIGQIYFITPVGEIKKYDGRYQNSRGSIVSRGIDS